MIYKLFPPIIQTKNLTWPLRCSLQTINGSYCPWRFLGHLLQSSTRDSKTMTLGDFVLVWMKLQSEFLEPPALYMRILKRVLHFFAQRVEASFSASMTRKMPAPQAGKSHPFERHFRNTGGKSVLMSQLAAKFMVRGGGFVSLKDEKSLQDLGLVSAKSKLAGKCASQFVTLHLVKGVQITADVLNDSEFPVINFCCDAARVFKQQASLPKDI